MVRVEYYDLSGYHESNRQSESAIPAYLFGITRFVLILSQSLHLCTYTIRNAAVGRNGRLRARDFVYDFEFETSINVVVPGYEYFVKLY